MLEKKETAIVRGAIWEGTKPECVFESVQNRGLYTVNPP